MAQKTESEAGNVSVLMLEFLSDAVNREMRAYGGLHKGGIIMFGSKKSVIEEPELCEYCQGSTRLHKSADSFSLMLSSSCCSDVVLRNTCQLMLIIVYCPKHARTNRPEQHPGSGVLSLLSIILSAVVWPVVQNTSLLIGSNKVLNSTFDVRWF